MNCPNDNFKHIPKEKFAFVQKDQRLHDRELETKPIGFFKDAMLRFSRNKGAVVCAFIILILAIYAVLAPMVSQVGPGAKDAYYSYSLPKLSNSFDLGFWNGCSDEKLNQQTYDYYSNMLSEASTTLEMVEYTGRMYEVADSCLNYIWNLTTYHYKVRHTINRHSNHRSKDICESL